MLQTDTHIEGLGSNHQPQQRSERRKSLKRHHQRSAIKAVLVAFAIVAMVLLGWKMLTEFMKVYGGLVAYQDRYYIPKDSDREKLILESGSSKRKDTNTHE